MKRLIGLALIWVAAASNAQVALRPVATGLDQPTSLTHADDSRLFVTLQRGQIVALDAGERHTFLDIRSLVSCCSERGLLSLAFHPKYGENGFYYVDYTDLNGDTVIARYSSKGAAAVKL